MRGCRKRHRGKRSLQTPSGEIQALKKFDASEAVDASAFEGGKVLPTRSVDTVGKSRFVAKEPKTWSTDENYAQAMTMATNRLIDVVATRRKHLLLGIDSHRALLHL